MLTAKRITRLKKAIQKCRARLLKQNPTFGVLLMYFRFVAHSKIKKISTDGRTVYFSPAFIEKITERELEYALCHQLMHVALGHTQCLEKDLLAEFHLACDIYINAKFAESGVPLKQFRHLGLLPTALPWSKSPVGDKTEAEIRKMSEMGFFYFLDAKNREKYFFDSVEFCNGGCLDGEETLILDIPLMDRETDPVLSKKEEDPRIKKGREPGGGLERIKFPTVGTEFFFAMKTVGKDTPMLHRPVGRRKKSTLDWRKILVDFIQTEVCDFSFAPPDRRFQDFPFFLPDFNETSESVKNILLLVDTSASISKTQLTAAYSEICGVFEQFGGKITGQLSFFDAVVYPPVPIGAGESLPIFRPTGGGGTNFDILFDFISQEYIQDLPSAIVIFTDGCALYPDASDAKGIPVLWIINNEQETPPWGKVARINAK